MAQPPIETPEEREKRQDAELEAVEYATGLEQPSEDQPAPTPTPTGDLDQQGIKKIVPDAASGRYETNFSLNKKVRNYASGKPSEPSVEYINDAKTPILNQEFTYYVKINGFKDVTDAISSKILGGHHTSSNPPEGTCYDVQIDIFGDATQNLEVERPHPKMHECNQKPQTTLGEKLVGKYIGIKAITYLINSGKDRRIQEWIDYPVPDITKPPNNWRMLFSVDDTAQLPSGHIIQPFGSLTTSRIDGVWSGPVNKNPQVSDVSAPDFKYASVREIQAEGAAPPRPPPPPNPVCPDGQHWDTTLNKCVKDVVTPPPPPTGKDVDQFGIQKMYSDRVGTYNSWVQTTANDPRFFEGRVLDAGNGWLKPDNNTQIRIEVLSDTSANENTVETFDVGKCTAKGYIYKPIDSPDNKGDFGDFEMTWRFKGITGSGSQNGTCHVELVPGGYRQTNDSKMVGKDKAVPASCEAMSYHFNLYPNGRAKFEKDSQHTSGYTKSDPEKNNAMGTFGNNKEIIQKAILYRTMKGMKLESYVDESGTGTQFSKVLEFEDSGQWGPTRGGNSTCHCGEFPILSMGRVALGYRGDNWNSFEFKDASIRSIDSGRPLHAATKQQAPHESMIEEEIERSED